MITRILADGDQTLQSDRPPEGGLSTVAREILRHPIEPIRLSRYILLEPLGQGAFGAVYAAYDPELNRKVAIKLLVPRKDHGADPDKGRDRLLREAQAMAHFTHPNVVAIYDVGTYSLPEKIRNSVNAVVRDGVFLVMELVDGQRFDQWAQSEGRGWREILAGAIDSARGLAAAHDAGLVHRDFKPSNVLVDRSGQPKVLDFGLARLHGEGSVESRSLSHSDEHRLASMDVSESLTASDSSLMLGEVLTRTGAVLGTPRYMALEQHRGDEASALSDQFSFCVTLYELLYGESPFPGRDLDALIRDKLDTRQLRPPNKDVPAWVFAVVRRGLDPDPAERYPDMRALIEALVRDPVRRRTRQGLVVGMLTVIVASSVAVGRLSSGSTTCESHTSELAGVWDPEVAARIEASFSSTEMPYAGRSFETLSVSLDQWAQDWVEQRVTLCEAERHAGDALDAERGRSLVCLERHRRRTEGLTRVLGRADEEVVAAAGLMAAELESPKVCMRRSSVVTATQEQPDEVARVRAEEAVAEARALMAVQKESDALEAARSAVEQSDGAGIELQARARLTLASVLLSAGHPKEAKGEANQAIELAERAGDDELTCESMVVLFRALAESGDHDGAELVARLATSRIEAALVGDRVAAILAYHQGALRLAQGRYSEAYEQFTFARALRERLHGPSHPLVAQLDNALGVALYRDGRRDEARAAFELAIANFEAALGADHPQVSRVHNNFGNYFMAAGKYEQAYAQLQRSAEINAASYPPDHPSHGTSHFNLARVAIAMGDRLKALHHLEQAEEVRSKRHGKDHPDVLIVRARQAGILADLGREYEAVAVLREILRIQQMVLGTGHPDTLETAFSLAGLLGEMGELSEAITLAEESIAHAKTHKAGANSLGRWSVTMARIYRMADRLDDAEATATRALELLQFESGETSPVISQAHLVRGSVALDNGDATAAEASFDVALKSITELFGAEHGRLAWPLRRRAAARQAGGDLAGARDDLERALVVCEGYNGPPLQPPGIRFELAQVLPDAQRDRARALIKQAREDLRGIRETNPGMASEANEMEQAMDRWLEER